jgi:hypothetical protein
MSIETIETLGQLWYKCPFEWSLEDFVTVQSEQAGRLILVRIEKVITDTGTGIRVVPVTQSSLPTYKGG